MNDRSSLYSRLSPDAQYLYDYVEKNLPTGEQSSVPFGIDRRGSRRDDPFRSLVRAVVEGAAEPRRWMRGAWPDEEVAKTSRDPEVLRRAWALLNEKGDGSWAAKWRRRVRNDRRASVAVWITLAIGAVVSFVTQSGWPLGRAVLLILLVLTVSFGRSRGASRAGDR